MLFILSSSIWLSQIFFLKIDVMFVILASALDNPWSTVIVYDSRIMVLLLEKTVSEVTQDRDEVEKANQQLHGKW